MEKLRQHSVWLHLPITCLAHSAPDKSPVRVCYILMIKKPRVHSTGANLQDLERQTLVRSPETQALANHDLTRLECRPPSTGATRKSESPLPPPQCSQLSIHLRVAVELSKNSHGPKPGAAAGDRVRASSFCKVIGTPSRNSRSIASSMLSSSCFPAALTHPGPDTVDASFRGVSFPSV